MTRANDTPPASAPSPQSTALTTIRADGWTPQRQVEFLSAIAAGHSVAEAARMVGRSRTSAYALRARLKGEPFDRAWHAATRCQFDALLEAAMERALHGVEVPHLHKGEVVHTSRRYDERLTIALLAMRSRFGPHGKGRGFADSYDLEDLNALLDRVALGTQTWDEETDALDEGFDAHCAAERIAEHGEGWDDPFDDDDPGSGADSIARWPEK
jgi:hypothetical protein